MGRIATRKISFAILAILACGSAMAQELERAPSQPVVVPYTASCAFRVTFGSNLFREPCSNCNYDSSAGGYFLWGPDNCTSPGRAEWLAVPFIAAATGVPERVLAAIILTNPAACPTNKVRLSIYSDACYPRGP